MLSINASSLFWKDSIVRLCSVVSVYRKAIVSTDTGYSTYPIFANHGKDIEVSKTDCYFHFL